VIRVELAKLFRRPRTWISMALTCALPFVVAVFIAITHLTPPPGQGSAFLSAVLEDGALYPAAALALILPVFLPVAVAVVAGDSIAGEAAAGTLRYLLVRPVGRTRLLVAKLVSVTVYVLLVVLAVTFTAYATGVFLLGPSRAAAVGQAPPGSGVAGAGGAVGPGIAGQAPTAGQAAGGAVTSLSGAPLSLLQLTERIAGAIAFITVSMLGRMSNPSGTRIWKPPCAVTGAALFPQMNSRYQGSPGVTQPSSPNISQATPSSNGPNPS